MNKSELTRRLAHDCQSSNVEAADYLDQAVLSILKRWKHGQLTPWPGLGIFYRDTDKTPPKKSVKSEAR